MIKRLLLTLGLIALATPVFAEPRGVEQRMSYSTGRTFAPVRLHGETIMLPIVRAGGPFFVSYTDGDDTNNGTAKATPLKHVPQYTGGSGVNGCTANCATIGSGLTGDDRIVLKGSDTWPYPNVVGIYRSGSSGHPISYESDITWFRGGSWSRPLFDMSYSTQICWVVDNGVSWINISGIEFAHIDLFPWDASPITDGQLIGGAGFSHVNMDDLYLHGWRCTTCTTNSAGGAVKIAVGSISPITDAVTNTLSNTNIDNAENTGHSPGGSVGTAVTYVGVMTNVNINNASSAVLFTQDYNGGEVYNIGWPVGNYPASCSGSNPHCNVIYQDGGNMGQGIGGSSYIRNIYMHDIGFTIPGIYPNPNGNHKMYVYNNLVGGHWELIPGIDIDTYNYSGTPPNGSGGTVYAYSNIIDFTDAVGAPSSCIGIVGVGGDGRPKLDNIYVANNQCIAPSLIPVDDASSSNVSGIISELTNLPQTSATAAAQLYTQAHLWAPQNGAGATVGAGTDLSSVFTLTRTGATRTPPWDIGAYQWVPSSAGTGPGRLIFR